MTKVIPLNSNQKHDKNGEHQQESLVMTDCDWNITIFPNGNFFSGFPDFMATMLEYSCNGFHDVDLLVQQTEKNYNVNIFFGLAVFEEKISRTQIFYPPPYRKLIDKKDNKEKLLFEIIPIDAGDICEIWHENNSLDKIYKNLEKARDLTNLFMRNVDMAWDIDVNCNGELDKSFGETFKQGFAETTIYDLKNFKNYITKGNPKEQYKFMGLYL